MDGEEQVASSNDGSRLKRAIRLFEFLARIQQIKSPTPRTVDSL